MNAETKHPTPNVDGLMASSFAALAWVTWPKQPDAYFAQGLLAGFMVMGAGIACSRFLGSLRLSYSRRKLKREALRSTTTLGKARFASLTELSLGKFHDLGNPLLLGERDGLPVTLPKGMSLACKSNPGGGKTSAIVINSLWHAANSTGSSIILPDIKPEMAYLLGPALEEAGFRVVYQNYAGLPDFPHMDTNPFHIILVVADDPESQRELFPLAEALATALIPDAKDDKDKFWRLNERSLLIFAMVALAMFEPEHLAPGGLYLALLDPKRLEYLCFKSMQSPDVLNGDLAAMASNLQSQMLENPDHFQSARTGASNNLSVFKPSSALGQMGMRNDFLAQDMRDETKPPMIVIDLIPSDRMAAYSKANALVQTSRMQSLRKHREGRPVLYLADEATSLPLPGIVNDIELLRSFKITVALFFQSLGSLRRVYGKDQADSVLSSCAELYFNVSTLETAEQISRRIGDITTKTNSYSFDEHGKGSQSYGEQSKRLMPPEEILALPKNKAILLCAGIRPILFNKAPWYEVEPLKSIAADNPHEQFPPSKKTIYALEYGNGAEDIKAPRLVNRKKRWSAARAKERAENYTPPLKRVRARDFLFVPIMATIASCMVFGGTPHVLLQYTKAPNPQGSYTCQYAGISGVRQVYQDRPCAAVQLVSSQRHEVAS
ncbi:MAG: type IV secretory system conjugative DNA transfer family protein [Pseudomonadota bacterium]